MPEIRDAVAGDAAALAEIFFQGVQSGAAPAYSQAERDAWCPEAPDPQRFWEGLKTQTILVATENGQPLGFMSLTDWGHLHMAYVLPAMRGTGLASKLLAVLENRALTQGSSRLTARASHLARPFLARNGWKVVEPVTVERNGVTLHATNMFRRLP